MRMAQIWLAERSPWIIASGLFLLALIPRVLGLGSYVTHDEPFWLLNSIRCIHGLSQGDLMAAFQSAHPGVPPLIGHGALLGLYYALTGQPDLIPAIAQSGWEIWFPPHLYHLLPEMIAVAGLFTAGVSALTVAAAYLLVRRLCDLPTGPLVALFAGLFLAVDPYFLALSRVVGVDAVLAGSMLLSLLLLLAYMAKPERTFALLGAGVCAALAILTKTSAGFLIPFTVVILAVYVTFCLLTDRPAGWSGRRWLLTAVVWAGSMGFAFLCLWPAAWQNPAAALTRLLGNVKDVVSTPHESAGYFLGQAVADPGALYYWAVLLFRLTPLTLPLSLLGAAFLAGDVLRRRWRMDATLMLTTLLYAILFLAMMSLAAKKQERYVLPALLALDVLAAWALARLLGWLGSLPRLRWNSRRLGWAAVGLTLITSLWWFRLHPHYYAYQNPVVGGVPLANWVYLTGWGEGNELAAAYLRQLPNAADLVTVASFDAGVGAYTPGVTLWLSPQTLPLADYAVVYTGSIRHDPTTAALASAFAGRQPAHTVYLDGLPYVRVYALTDQPRRLLAWQTPPIPHPQRTVVGENLIFLGYAGDPLTARPGETLPLTLYWQCLRPVSRDYTVFVHLVDPASGRRWGQWDSIPVGGRFPTSWWLPGLTIRDDVAVPVNPAAPPGAYELRVGLYDVQTSRRLWVGEQNSGRDSITLGRATITGQTP